MSVTARQKTLLSLACAAVAALSFTASPAWAGDESDAQACWQDADTGVTQCFTDEATLDAAIESQTGSRLAAPGSASRSSVVALTTYILATWYEDSGYGGSFLKTTSTNSAACTAGTINLNFPGAWNDRVSSYKTWYGCTGTIYQNTGQGGSSFGPSTAASSVGGMNDQASSYRLT